MIERSVDHKGNSINYVYKQENNQNITPSIFEAQRLKEGKAFTNVYLKKVQYGTPSPFSSLTGEYPGDTLFTLVFDYGEHGQGLQTYGEQSEWPVREDPFSVYRSGFEVRTWRLCRNILMFHHFEELANDPFLIKKAALGYDHRPELSLLKSITLSGYDEYQDEASYPAVEFIYSEASPGEKTYRLDTEDLKNFTTGANGESFQWTDLYNEGLSGILIQNRDHGITNPTWRSALF